MRAQGTRLREAAVAQREAARTRREATASFAGVFSSEVALRAVGWLTVTVDSLKHPPACSTACGEEGGTAGAPPLPERLLSLVVRATGSERHALPEPDMDSLLPADETRAAPADAVVFGSSFTFEISKQQLLDRSEHVAVEIHSPEGVFGAVSVPTFRIARPGGCQLWSGVYELRDPNDQSKVVCGFKQPGTFAPATVHLKFFYLALSQRKGRSQTYSRGAVTPFTANDFGLTRPQSAQEYARPHSSQASRSSSSSLRLISAWGALGGRFNGPTDGRLETDSGPRKKTTRLPSRPQSVHSERAEYRPNSPLSRSGPRHALLPTRPQSTGFLQENFQTGLVIDSRPQSPQSLNKKSPERTGRSAHPIDAIFGSPINHVLRLTYNGRPFSAGVRQKPRKQLAGPDLRDMSQHARSLLLMPIARSAELHTQIQQTANINTQVIETPDGAEMHDEAINVEQQRAATNSTDLSAAETGSNFTKLSSIDNGLSAEGKSILAQIESSTRDWNRLQALLHIERQNILEIVTGLFERMKSKKTTTLSLAKLGDAMLLLCARHFTRRELAALTQKYMPPAASQQISKVQFQEIALDGLSMDLHSTDTVSRCAQRLRFLAMEFCTPGSFTMPGSAGAIESESTGAPGDGDTNSCNAQLEAFGAPEMATICRPSSSVRQPEAPARRQEALKMRVPVVMPAVGVLESLGVVGRAVG